MLFPCVHQEHAALFLCVVHQENVLLSRVHQVHAALFTCVHKERAVLFTCVHKKHVYCVCGTDERKADVNGNSRTNSVSSSDRETESSSPPTSAPVTRNKSSRPVGWTGRQ